MALGFAVLLLAGLVATIVIGGALLIPASSGQTAVNTPPQTTDSPAEELSLPESGSDTSDQGVETDVIAINTDEDGDGLITKDEARLKTDPTNPNTDGDRYRDNEDPNPISKNSAEVKIIVSDLESQENYDAIDSGMLNQETLATVIVDMVVKNDGDDYASFVKFDGVFLMDGIELERVTRDIGRIDAGESLDMHITYTLWMLDIPYDVRNEIKSGIDQNVPPVISFEIRNLTYEKF